MNSLTIEPMVIPFAERLGQPLAKSPITVLQINLGKRCNLTCSHCHVEAGPQRTEEIASEVCAQLIQIIQQFPQLETVDLTGGAPEMHDGFRPLVAAAREAGKTVMVRSNLTIFFEPGFADLPDYLAENQVHMVASLPCYQAENVDKMRGKGVFEESIRALQWLNLLGYGQDPHLKLDLVYNPQIPTTPNFRLTPNQNDLERSYKEHLQTQFSIQFNRLFTITNLPIGRTKFLLEHRQLDQGYVQFLADHFNPKTLEGLMCRNELSVDYQGFIYDCDFNQMENLPAKLANGEPLTVARLLELGTLDVLAAVQTANYCYGCTAGSGSSCGGSLV